MNNEYKLSEKTGNIWTVGIVLGVLLISIVSSIYVLIDLVNPFKFLNIFIFAGYFIAVYISIKIALKVAKSRSSKNSFRFGVIIGILAIYINWYLFVLFQLIDANNISFSILMLDAINIFYYASEIANDGYYFDEILVSNGFLYFFWIIEAILIIIAGLIGGFGFTHEEVYCEECDRWVDLIGKDIRLSIADKDKLDTAIKEDIGLLTEFPIAKKNETPHLKVNIHHCEKCKNLSTVDIDYITIRKNDDGKFVEDNKDYSPVFLIDKETYTKLHNIRGRKRQ